MKKLAAAAAAISILCAPVAANAQMAAAPAEAAAVAAPGAAAFPGIPVGNHYVCYPAKLRDAFIVRPATFTDQFGTWNVKVIGVTRLCVPARKMIGHTVFPIVDAKLHLFCYKIELGSQNHLPMVVTNDQFGGHMNVTLSPPTEVCLPAGKMKMG